MSGFKLPVEKKPLQKKLEKIGYFRGSVAGESWKGFEFRIAQYLNRLIATRQIANKNETDGAFLTHNDAGNRVGGKKQIEKTSGNRYWGFMTVSYYSNLGEGGDFMCATINLFGNGLNMNKG